MDFSHVERLAAGGESERVEFKLSTGQRREAARTLPAMLNGQGGSVIFGICRDDPFCHHRRGGDMQHSPFRLLAGPRWK